ncbi:MAG: hybrid sensor histidine kinase/response regulator [Acidiphilium sp. 37-64-53]|uniref:hybrid sensor histidine kinase/response regulator n=1 Tax=Acidiphilium TaxID=522 RepID=UPI000BCAD3F6|nr:MULTISPECIES: ATP-binding protein [Acidiphilium]OYW03569.1 MAG: hybrid sensor histidine kinase/response regulator [Acidiphilium sp. 37-64-53]OZB29490.1 MAG: hybrid sensor histidine kinase/response regulator [Acidiphilium sp. 34-64-41]HQT84219.1 ATP-binding protein [Acidiphilium rubrum]
MALRQRITAPRRSYNQWVANETMEDYALRFTALSARRFSAGRVADTAFGATAFLALEAIGGAITLRYGFANAMPAILIAGLIIALTAGPIALVAARAGVDIDLLTRGAGFGYLGSTVTSLIYASFTFIFFAIEASILSGMLAYCLGIPEWLGYIISAGMVLPMVAFGITFISRFQWRTRGLWLVLNFAPLIAIMLLAARGRVDLGPWVQFGAGFRWLDFGAALSVIVSLIVQIGEQVDYLRFLPPPGPGERAAWWRAVIIAGPGWVVPGIVKLAAGSLLAVLAVRAGAAISEAGQPVMMYRTAWAIILPHGLAFLAIPLTVALVLVAQLKINVTNAYAGSIAWSNFFSRLTHRHPGRIVWVFFNVAIALMLMELGIYRAIEHILAFYAVLACAWVGAIFGDLAIAKPLGLAPARIEFKRAHLFDINPVGLGAMGLAVLLGSAAMGGLLGPMARAFAPIVALVIAIGAAPAIAALTRGRFYLARKPRKSWQGTASRVCVVCANAFEGADMAHCPVYAAPICSLCCTLEARCHDACKPQGRYGMQLSAVFKAALPGSIYRRLSPATLRFAFVFAVAVLLLGGLLAALYGIAGPADPASSALLARALWRAFLLLAIVAGVVAWLGVLARESRRAAEGETAQQTRLLLAEIAAHKRTDAQLARAREAAESANLAKSRFVVGISHELRSPLNAILGYAQLLEVDPTIPEKRRHALRVIRRSGEHLSGLIEGLMDIAKIEAGRIEIERRDIRLHDFLSQIADMFRHQAEARGIGFVFDCPQTLPETVTTDPTRLRQILINLLSNAIKFTTTGEVRLAVRVPGQVAEFTISDTGPGIAPEHRARIFEPFERIAPKAGAAPPGIGLGLTITKLLAQILGGDISVTSELGRGSIFTVRLMLSHRARGVAIAPPRPAVTGYAGARKRVLVTDDNATHRALLEDALTPLGFTVLSAPDIRSCLDLAQSTSPDLFILDLTMPDGDGVSLAHRLRAAGHQSTPMILVSADAGEVARLRGGDSPFDALLVKPVDLRQLVADIGRLLGLDWETGMTMPMVATDAAPASMRLVPYAGELRRLAEIGFVRPLRERIDELTATDPGAAPVLGELRRLLDEFRLPELIAALADLDRDAA